MVTVLLVDDSKLARIVAGKTIAALQPEWQRVEASNAEEALQAVKDQPVDLAVLDFNMPGKDGLELAAELRESYPQMPIAIITANVQNEIVARARELNATFVGKPVTEDAIKGFLRGAALRLRQVGA
ncbi:response regulator transcription factor [Devosia sp. RR2S18]|uniref:response regulator transcription factor n=1 Tax=Devosia rhizosphaerae TaxID=3049774 RepID=UPI0025406287|nr:response regulator [Devosia sp. RR2S18]WIJ25839.1 response regulator [Devosia sp. RR2S18]